MSTDKAKAVERHIARSRHHRRMEQQRAQLRSDRPFAQRLAERAAPLTDKVSNRPVQAGPVSAVAMRAALEEALADGRVDERAGKPLPYQPLK